jgi:hypothetical protein
LATLVVCLCMQSTDELEDFLIRHHCPKVSEMRILSLLQIVGVRQTARSLLMASRLLSSAYTLRWELQNMESLLMGKFGDGRVW